MLSSNKGNKLHRAVDRGHWLSVAHWFLNIMAVLKDGYVVVQAVPELSLSYLLINSLYV